MIFSASPNPLSPFRQINDPNLHKTIELCSLKFLGREIKIPLNYSRQYEIIKGTRFFRVNLNGTPPFHQLSWLRFLAN